VTGIEKAFTEDMAGRARRSDLGKYVGLAMPTIVDYSPNVTFLRCQDAGGGCMSYTVLHTADMLNELRHPYSPPWYSLYGRRRPTNLPSQGSFNRKRGLWASEFSIAA